jgi:hypothetical protein
LNSAGNRNFLCGIHDDILRSCVAVDCQEIFNSQSKKAFSSTRGLATESLIVHYTPQNNSELTFDIYAVMPSFRVIVDVLILLAAAAVIGRRLWRSFSAQTRRKAGGNNNGFVKLRLSRDIATIAQTLRIPHVEGLFLCLATSGATICILDLFFGLSPRNEILSKWGSVVTIQTGVVAILFPLLILILDKEATSEGPVRTHEALLSHALAFPVSIFLLTFLLYFVLGRHHDVAVILAVASVAMTMFVVFRLLEATFSVSVRQSIDTSILKLKVADVTASDIATRVAFKETKDALDARKDRLEFAPYLLSGLGRRQEDEFIYVIESHQSGVVESIDLQKLWNLAGEIRSYLGRDVVSLSQEQQSNDHKEGDPGTILIARHVGASISQGEDAIGAIRFSLNGRAASPIGVFAPTDEAKIWIKRIKKKFLAAFTIVAEDEEKAKALDALMIGIKQQARSAIVNGDTESLKRVRQAYEAIYDSFVSQMKEYGIRYNVENAKSEVPLFGFSWKPYELLVKHLREIIRIAASTSKIDEEVLDAVLHVPYFLAFDALNLQDALGFYTFTSMAALEESLLKKLDGEDRPVVEWLESLSKYHLKRVIEKSAKSADSDLYLSFLKVVVATIQEMMRLAILSNDKKRLRQLIDTLGRVTDIYEHEDLDHHRMMRDLVEGRNRQ